MSLRPNDEDINSIELKSTDLLLYFDSFEYTEDKDVQHLFEMLPDSVKNRIKDRKPFENHKKSVVAWNLVKKSMEESDFSVGFGEHGKPFLINEKGEKIEDKYFSLSHSGRYCAVSFGKVENGCDLQEEKDIPERRLKLLAKKCLSAMEYENWNRMGSNAHEFYLYWASKEAVSKCIGLGMAAGFDNIEIDLCKKKATYNGEVFDLFFPERAPQKYVCVVATYSVK